LGFSIAPIELMMTGRKKHVCASELGLNHAAKNFNCLRFEAWNRLLPASVEDRDFILNGDYVVS
jgi:hypothetical protein